MIDLRVKTSVGAAVENAAAVTTPAMGGAAASRDRPVRRRRGRSLLVAIALLLAGEAVVRLWDATTGGTGSLYDHVVHKPSRFVLTASTTVNVPERYGTVRYSFNRQVYRDRDHDPRSPLPRILVLGDSVAFGLGTLQEQIFAAVLQRRLDASPGQRYEVVNQAVFAYHSGHELAALREDGLAQRPRVVIVQFYMNDLSQPAIDERRSAPPPPSFGQRLVATKNRYLNRSALWRRIRQGVTRAIYLLLHDVRRTHFPETLNDAEPRDKVAYLQRHANDPAIPAFASILAMRDLAAAQGARFLLLVTPDETQLFTSRYDGIDQRVARFCARYGIACFDALPVLRAAPHRERLYLDGVHLSAAGHDLVGRHLAAQLRSGGLVSAP